MRASHCSTFRLGSLSARGSTCNARPLEPLGALDMSPGLGSLDRLRSLSFLYWAGISGMPGMSALFLRSGGAVVIFWEYLLLTRSAVLSGRCGFGCDGRASGRVLDLLDSFEGRPEPGSEDGATLTGMGALICRGALMVGGAFFLLLSPRFLRREMPFCFSDMLPAEMTAPGMCRGKQSCAGGRSRSSSSRDR